MAVRASRTSLAWLEMFLRKVFERRKRFVAIFSNLIGFPGKRWKSWGYPVGGTTNYKNLEKILCQSKSNFSVKNCCERPLSKVGHVFIDSPILIIKVPSAVFKSINIPTYFTWLTFSFTGPLIFSRHCHLTPS